MRFSSIVTFGFVVYIVGAGVSCGRSPLLNHRDAEARNALPAPAPSGAPGGGDHDTTRCPLRFQAEALCAELTWDATPTDQGANSFRLLFWSANGGTPNDPSHSVFVKLWMPAMGHGSSPVTLSHLRASDGGETPGSFHGSDVYFIMPGAWEVHVELRDGTQVIEEAIAKLQI